jgi:hypothetical protein
VLAGRLQPSRRIFEHIRTPLPPPVISLTTTART